MLALLAPLLAAAAQTTHQVWDTDGWPLSGGPPAAAAPRGTIMSSSDAAAAPIRVTCVGDSITIHACASNNSMPYPEQLGRMLGPQYTVLNAGNSGKNLLKKGLCGGGGNCCGLPPGAGGAPPGVSPCTDPRINSKNLCPKCGGDCAYWDQSTYKIAMDSKPDIVVRRNTAASPLHSLTRAGLSCPAVFKMPP